MGAEQGHKSVQRDEAPLLQGKAERFEIVQHGEQEALRRPFSTLQYLNRA